MNDRFGNPTVLKLAKQVVNKKSGEIVDAFKTYFEYNGKLLKIEICSATPNDKHDGGLWVKMTETRKQNTSNGSFNGGAPMANYQNRQNSNVPSAFRSNGGFR